MERAMAGRRLTALVLSDDERAELTALAARRNTAQALALRARIVLRCATGTENQQVAADLRIDKTTVGKWRGRFVERRMDGLRDEPRSSAHDRRRPHRSGDVRTLESVPRDATHWSSRGMAGASGLSISTVRRIWRAFGLQPHRLETFKLSTDPDFVAKVRDVVGLYVSPPAHAIVLCVDEKSQIQALDRNQPMLPMRPGQPARRRHDYKRHGTTSLFAALHIATGRVIGKCYPRHRTIEFRKFLNEIEAAAPADLDVHMVIDNYATHKAPLIRNWLARRLRWHVHLTPTSSSWLNQVERFFALLTERQLRRGIHRSVVALKTTITTFIDQHNADPKPFRWTKSADDILASACTTFRSKPNFNATNFWFRTLAGIVFSRRPLASPTPQSPASAAGRALVCVSWTERSLMMMPRDRE
jgi:transposase